VYLIKLLHRLPLTLAALFSAQLAYTVVTDYCDKVLAGLFIQTRQAEMQM
jgi:hypothetical protein